eukprot:gene9343-10328_t
MPISCLHSETCLLRINQITLKKLVNLMLEDCPKFPHVKTNGLASSTFGFKPY